MSVADPVPLLEACAVSKRFPGSRALHRVSMRLARGEVLAVVGENGAGKSTLMRILSGIERLDSGSLHIDGHAVTMSSPRRARSFGIALIHQELDVADNLSVAENLFLGREPHRCGLVDRARLQQWSRQALARVGADFAPTMPVAALSIGQRQLVAVARALAQDARVLIMDEPTSSLSSGEVERLFTVIDELRRRGVSVIYVSHRLAEVQRTADRVIILRDGEVSGELTGAAIQRDTIIGLMIGRTMSVPRPRARPGASAAGLDVEGLVVPGAPGPPLRLQVDAGAIVGLAGLVGAGRSELLQALFGLNGVLPGRVRVRGHTVRIRHPRDAIRAGLGLVPEDRQLQGLFLDMAIGDNVTLAAIDHARASRLLDRAFERRLTDAMVEHLQISAGDTQRPVRTLSGGNQQKVVLARWLALQPHVLLLDEPTRGVDVGARQEIHAMLQQLAEQGMAILLASSDLEELLLLCDRIAVLHERALVGQLDRAHCTEDAVMRMATGAAARR